MLGHQDTRSECQNVRSSRHQTGVSKRQVIKTPNRSVNMLDHQDSRSECQNVRSSRHQTGASKRWSSRHQTGVSKRQVIKTPDRRVKTIGHQDTRLVGQNVRSSRHQTVVSKISILNTFLYRRLRITWDLQFCSCTMYCSNRAVHVHQARITPRR